MASVIKYSLFLLADLAIIGFIVHFTLSMLRGSNPADERLTRRRHPGKFDKLTAYPWSPISGRYIRRPIQEAGT
jgi:hypothetical protein